MSGFSIREITRGLEPISHAIKPRVTPEPRIGDKVVVTLPGGAKHPGVLVGRLYGSKASYECRVAGALAYFTADEVEVS